MDPDLQPGYGVKEEKEYIITELGRQAFETEKSRLEELLNNAKLMEEGER